uniref:hypothetical protein n=1 Tax=Hafnia sp. TaxID=1873498 RepID=UPI003FA5E942
MRNSVILLQQSKEAIIVASKPFAVTAKPFSQSRPDLTANLFPLTDNNVTVHIYKPFVLSIQNGCEFGVDTPIAHV